MWPFAPKALASKPLVSKPYQSGDLIVHEGLSLRLRLNPRARRIGLRIDAKAKEAVLTLPKLKDIAQGLSFAKSRQAWIESHLQNLPTEALFAPGQILSVGGLRVRLEQSFGKGAAKPMEGLDGPILKAGAMGQAYSQRIERFLKQLALQRVQEETQTYAKALGVEALRISVFDPKGRWGSCTPARKTIRLSWRLILAPPSVLSYVCAHEAAHLKHPNHSPAFWAEVEGLFGDYKPARDWLKSHGHRLFHPQSLSFEP